MARVALLQIDPAILPFGGGLEMPPLRFQRVLFTSRHSTLLYRYGWLYINAIHGVTSSTLSRVYV